MPLLYVATPAGASKPPAQNLYTFTSPPAEGSQLQLTAADGTEVTYAVGRVLSYPVSKYLNAAGQTIDGRVDVTALPDQPPPPPPPR